MALLDLERGRAQTVWNKLWRQKVDWQDGTVDIPADNDDYPWSDPVVASHHSYAFVDVRVLVETLALSDYGNPSEPTYLVFRTEYLTLLEALISSRLSKVHNLVITGQPGIGKSFFLLFLLVFRLERGLPTAFQYHSTHYFLFDDAGGTAFYATYHHQRLAPCWALTDSNDEVFTPCSPLKNFACRNIMSASPLKTERWESWLKYAMGQYIITDLPTMQEIVAVMHVRHVLPAETLKIARKWGPSLRVVRSLAEHPERETIFLSNAQAAAVALYKNPRLLFPSVLTSIGSTLVFVRPRRRAPDCEITAAASLFIPTQFLYGVLERECTSAPNKQALQLFFLLSKHSLTRSATGWKHEQNVHTRLTTGSTALTIFRGHVKEEMLPSSNLLHCTLAGLNGVFSTDSFYWPPAVTKFPGVDGVLGDGKGNLYAIQATTGMGNKRRSPVDGLRLLWTKVNAAVRHDLNWHLVLVTPDRPSARKQVADLSVKLRRFKLGNSCKVTVWGCGLSCQW
ncbi:hypothetical protein EXIGLDRAFT_829278 [Exidia glandulosa HHB12029]|uniref:Crinkler (CRN) family protein n=1 Tax=Exidia glandulosa HHB12029 TaxID=1314781 RepID=A0A165PMG6_EXIGL|nr:hypothetical protein EXIGLDRAFT_829278 [Exidia glandulosa HHB12029]